MSEKGSSLIHFLVFMQMKAQILTQSTINESNHRGKHITKQEENASIGRPIIGCDILHFLHYLYWIPDKNVLFWLSLSAVTLCSLVTSRPHQY